MTFSNSLKELKSFISAKNFQLVHQNNQQISAKPNLTDDEKSIIKFTHTKTLSWWLVKGLSLVCTGYFLTILFQGIPKDNRLSTTDIGLISMVLIVNSEIIERLSNVQLDSSKGMLSVSLIPKLKANTEINQREAAALSQLGQLLRGNEERKKFFETLVPSDESEILKKLKSRIDERMPLLYDQDWADKLRHLEVLNFIKSEPYRSITKLKEGEDLTAIYCLTEWGKICLKYRTSDSNHSH